MTGDTTRLDRVREPSGTLVELTYFKPSGKYYAAGSLVLPAGTLYWDAVEHVQGLAEAGCLPGLTARPGPTSYHVLVTIAPGGVPHLILVQAND